MTMRTDDRRPPYVTEATACHHNDAAVRALSASDKNLWRAAYHSWRMWGTYQRDGVASIARDAKRSVSQVENYAHAYDMFATFVNFGQVWEVCRLRKSLTVSHFYKLWNVVMSGNHPRLKIEQCLQSLKYAALHEWSADRMITEMLIDIGATRPPKKIERVFKDAYNIGVELLARFEETTERHRAWARETIELFGDSDG